jgi:flagellar protein FlaF
MYHISYAEHLTNSPKECRERERAALEHAISLLCKAESTGLPSPTAAAALDFVSRLWNIFIQDLVDPENDLPEALKADLISVGLWVVKEAALIRCGQSKNLRGLSEICTIIRDGLK